MKHSRFTKIAVRATALAALLLGMAALSVLERRRTHAELGAVLSAFFSDAVLRDIHESGSGRGIQVIVLREGPQSAFWRARWFDRQTLFPQASPVTRSSFFLSNAVTTDTRAELHLPKGVDFVVVSRSELERGQPGDFERRFPTIWDTSRSLSPDSISAKQRRSCTSTTAASAPVIYVAVEVTS